MRIATELNEVRWWSGWGRVRWLSQDCYVLESADFEEPFFNRVGFLSSNASVARLDGIESALRPAGLHPYVSVFEPCKRALESLKRRGYTVEDRMAVLRMHRPAIRVNPEVHASKAQSGDLADWCETYLISFYGGLALKERVLRVAIKVAQSKSVVLLIARLNGETAGAAALYRSPGLLGLYCLGTLQQFRKRGVAHSLLGQAQDIAESEGRRMVLQSLLSEGQEGFYLKAGFERLYVKALLQVQPDGTRPGNPGAGPATFGALVDRDARAGTHFFQDVFRGFENVPVVKGIFGGGTRKVLSELTVEVVDEKGYMHINASKGGVVVSGDYLKRADERYLYLDIIHELVHIRQHMEGKELWDRSYKYVDRPTELEAYRLAVVEARRIGLSDEQLIDYLKVEWVSPEDFERLLVTLGVRRSRVVGS